MGELLFCCPLCGGALTRQEHRAVCGKGHSFDVARQGDMVGLMLRGVSREQVHAGDIVVVRQ